MSRGSRLARPARFRWVPSGIVTLLTDFGLEDAYAGIVKGVILAIHPAARLVDLTHRIPPQDVRRGALVLEAAYAFFPPGTVHLAVVDPGVGGPRRAIAVEADGHCFVGPDNGLLGFCFARPGARAVALANPAYYRAGAAGVSRTFHARDVFAPAAAHCAAGVPIHRFGPSIADPVRLPMPPVRRGRGRVRGEVILADRFGNLLTNVTAADVPGSRAGWRAAVGGRRIDGLVARYGDRPPGGLGALVDSSGRVEIFVRDGSARTRLGVGPGAPVSFSRASLPSRTTPETRPSTRTRRQTRRPRSSSPASSRPSSSRPPSPSSGTRRGSRSRTSRRP